MRSEKATTSKTTLKTEKKMKQNLRNMPKKQGKHENETKFRENTKKARKTHEKTKQQQRKTKINITPLSRSFASALWLVRRVQLHLSHPWHSAHGDKPWQVWAFMDFRHESLDLPEESGKQGTEVDASEVFLGVQISEVLREVVATCDHKGLLWPDKSEAR